MDADGDVFVNYVNTVAGDDDGVFASEAEADRFRVRTLITGAVGSAAELNHSLYALLREADGMGLRNVYIRKPPAWGEHLALFNRLIRAAAGQIVKI